MGEINLLLLAVPYIVPAIVVAGMVSVRLFHYFYNENEIDNVK